MPRIVEGYEHGLFDVYRVENRHVNLMYDWHGFDYRNLFDDGYRFDNWNMFDHRNGFDVVMVYCMNVIRYVNSQAAKKERCLNFVSL
ncbi:unnamed protein product [Arctia plantaginis]|uniref:Uncharacterized protein n=1 Tax=Arctia plantaginis TaxID=874455 RepID=A0A8S0ZH52_ARCPL|nr:unnamed protein product [Arctia plantaginis]